MLSHNLTGVDLDLIAELGRARARLDRAIGASEQADRAVEAARAAARRAAEAEGEARGLVDRLERELSTGTDRMPLIAAIEAAGAAAPDASRAGCLSNRVEIMRGNIRGEPGDDAPPLDYDRA